MTNKNNVTKPTKSNAANRSVVPLPDTIEHIKGYPDKLIIFKIGASPYWWVRTHDGKPIKRSTKTASKRDAITFAKNFYDQVTSNRLHGVSNNPRKTSFTICAEGMMAEDQAKVATGELSKSYVTNHKSILRGHISRFFAKRELPDIDYAELAKFKAYLFGLNLAVSTVKMHFVYVGKILDYGVRTKVITHAPPLPTIKNDDNPRGFFSLPEYALLRRTARSLRGSKSEIRQALRDDAGSYTGKTKKLRNVVIDEQIGLLIPFMIYTFIRPTDLKNIKHRHVEIKQGADGKDYLFMPLPTSKGHSKPITSMPRAAAVYKQLRALRLAQLGDASANIDDEYVFMPQHLNRDYAYRQITRQFNVLLKEADLRLNADNDVRTLYSLRHTSLMYRLKFGGEINPLILANNARTSVEMLERFYLSRIESSQFTAALHSSKQVKKPKAKPLPDSGKTVVVVIGGKPGDDVEPTNVKGSSFSNTSSLPALNLAGIASSKRDKG